MEQTTIEDFFFANDEERENEVLTHNDTDGKVIKQVTLPDSRKIFQMRKPLERDYLEATLRTKSKHKGKKLMGERLIVLMAICSTCNDKKVTQAEVNSLSIRDFTKLSFTFNCIITQ